MADIKMDRSQIDKLGRSFLKIKQDMKSKFNTDITHTIAPKVLKILIQKTPKDTGETAREWKIKKNGSSGFIITNGRGGIVEFLTEGVKPHLIEPKDSSVLVMKLGTSVIFAKFVNHPGYSKQMDKKGIFKQIANLIEKESNIIVSDKFKKNLT